MADLNNKCLLSVIIPSFNEAGNLPLLLADLQRWDNTLEILISDAGSSDETHIISNLTGAKLIQSKTKNRGLQLNNGAKNAIGDWLLFVHADSRLHAEWPIIVEKSIATENSKETAWFFDFKIKDSRIDIRLLEIAVSIRSNLLKKPYGDQGLLISKSLYNQVGGYKPLHLMEDLDIITRLSRQANIRSFRVPIYINPRRWEKKNVFRLALKNAILRYRWMKGAGTFELSKEYYRKD